MRSAIAILSAFVTFVVSTGCAHSVVIDSDPSGAEIKVNGEKLGVGPVTYNETTGWEKIYDIEASKPGYKAVRKQIKQTEWNVPVTAATGIGSFICFYTLGLPAVIGLLFARQLPDRVVVPLDKGAGAVDPGMAAPPSSYGY